MSSKKVHRTKGPSDAAASPEIQAILDAYAASPSAPPAPGLKKALAGFPSWLPHLSRRMHAGPAPLRKAALRVLRESGTQSAAEAIVSAVGDPRTPAWLRLFALGLEGSGEGAVPVLPAELRAELERLARGEEVDDRSRIELGVDAGDWDALASKFGEELTRDELLIAALVEHETPATGRFLLALRARSAGGAQEKALRKAAFSLRQRGLALEEAAPAAAPSAPVASAAPETQAFASHIDGDGARLLLIARGRSKDSGMDFLQFMLHEERGIVSFSRGWLPRREVKSVIDEIQGRDERVKLVAIDPAWSWHLLREAFAASRRSSTEIPEQFVRERHLWEIPEAPGGTRNPALAELDVEGLSPEDAAEVSREPELVGWGPERKIVIPWAERYRELEQSPVMVSPELKAGRLEEEIDRGAAEYVDGVRRQRYARRLEEMAGYFVARDRREAARRALAASRGMTQGGALHPLARALWRATLLDEVEELKRAAAASPVQEPHP